MKKGLAVLILILSFFLVKPVQAKTLDMGKINEHSLVHFHSVYLLDKEDITIDDVEDDLGEYNQEQSCDPDQSLLGNPNDPDSVAWLLQQILNYIRVLGPILVVVLSSIEFAKVIIQSDDEAMGKAQKKLINRLILVVALFFIPTIVEVVLQLFGIMGNPTCGIK